MQFLHRFCFCLFNVLRFNLFHASVAKFPSSVPYWLFHHMVRTHDAIHHWNRRTQWQEEERSYIWWNLSILVLQETSTETIWLWILSFLVIYRAVQHCFWAKLIILGKSFATTRFGHDLNDLPTLSATPLMLILWCFKIIFFTGRGFYYSLMHHFGTLNLPNTPKYVSTAGEKRK